MIDEDGIARKELIANITPTHFPLFEEGPFARVPAALWLAGTEQGQVRRKVVFVVLATWVPLAVLAAVQGCAIGPTWRESMLMDVGMYARYLVTLPLVILATPGFQRKLQIIVHHFWDAGLVKERERKSFFDNIPRHSDGGIRCSRPWCWPGWPSRTP